ncbi:MAG: alpha/beta fold hydrolase [Rhodoferax sp.]
MSASLAGRAPIGSLVDAVPCYALHGWCFGPDVWQEMAAHWPGLQALALPGYGSPGCAAEAGAPDLPPTRVAEAARTGEQIGTAVHSPGRTMEVLAQALAQRLPPHPVDVLGWSLGALVALQLAASAPQRVRRLVLLGATARFVAAPDWPHGVAPALLDGFRTELAQDAAVLRARFALLCAQGQAPAQARTVVRRLRALSSAPQPVLDDGLAVLASSDLRPILPRVQAPVLLLHGAHDALMPLAAAQSLAQALPDAHLQVLPDAGHALPLAAAQACAAAARAFLAGEGDPIHG